MTVPTALNSGEPTRVGAGSDTVTLVEGATFCLSDRLGDVVPGGSHGLFFRDARVLSRWELRVDGQVAESLSVDSSEAFTAQFILRRAPRAGLADSTLLVVRERLLADGLRETITLENMDRDSTVVSLELHADADFADLFSVKEGRTPLGGAEILWPTGSSCWSTGPSGCRGCPWRPRVLRGVAGLAGLASGGGPGPIWQTEIVAQPTLGSQPSIPGCTPTSTWAHATRPARSRPGAIRRPMSKPATGPQLAWCWRAPKVIWVRCRFMTRIVAAARSWPPVRPGS